MADRENAHARRMLLSSLVVVGMGFTVLFPVLSPLGREMGLSELQITTIIAASSLTVFLSSPNWGRLSDKYGRKRIMLTGIVTRTRRFAPRWSRPSASWDSGLRAS